MAAADWAAAARGAAVVVEAAEAVVGSGAAKVAEEAEAVVGSEEADWVAAVTVAAMVAVG